MIQRYCLQGKATDKDKSKQREQTEMLLWFYWQGSSRVGIFLLESSDRQPDVTITYYYYYYLLSAFTCTLLPSFPLLLFTDICSLCTLFLPSSLYPYYPWSGSTTMARGWVIFPSISVFRVREAFSSRATLIVFLGPSSVQYKLSAIQSTAIPSTVWIA